jgi:hypothetical protein
MGVDLLTTEEHKMVVMSDEEFTPTFKLAKGNDRQRDVLCR